MRRLTFGPAILILLVLASFPAIAQTQQTASPAASRDPQAVAVLQQAFRLLTGGNQVTDVTLSGTATRIAGSDNESGQVTLKVTAAGQNRIDLALSSGQRTEVRDVSTTPPSGAWSGPDGVQHPIPIHNLLSDPTWCFPALLLSHVLSTASYSVSTMDQGTLDGQPAIHMVVSQGVISATAQYSTVIQHLSQLDLYLDPTTLLPTAVAFSEHPDDNLNVDVGVKVFFSNYQTTSGVRIPLRITQYVNETLFLDFQLQTAQLNTGLSSSAFSLH